MDNIQLTKQQINFFATHGYLVVEDLISSEEIELYKVMYDDFLSGKIDVGASRSDLGEELGNSGTVENITQIMWPSDFRPELLEMSYHKRALEISRQLMGHDLDMDFDMLINKSPFTNTITPWHQDEAYWLNVPDKRAASCWLSLDYATLDSGCMWFVPGSNLKEVRPHTFAKKKGGALMCEASEGEGVAVELKPGSCTFHHGRTLHYSRGNATENQRRAFIVNFRPGEMICYERENGFDHGRQNAGDRQLKNDEFAG
ncbi:phytanoyl-CoA dioxygenase family protein [Dyadobacter pollutisoli]|uniref:Phytanoyl-CoA dioxygenase family protein n=1 Tax=Dyadobacter pollutisoli TaxID=2910158 RepID=A0A9E8SLR5_9BACT|nr:phytanoyl-CoA dioxygenase family protein [Dyadobacter pollutisoli]WAC13383.1 phytanoyl-CoA dioxygenase family protein [Dyadobacter pollutisoli]